ncbi:MAG: hypothetical protein M1833_003752 [Piccolia ochrophora]|nr:MAG: hypothetical protein M1833_003752 [Piccolia ochrophora]
MSRRPVKEVNDRTAQNLQTLKSLVKLKGNKSCADCKKNNNPRWASWNLGVFICIRCSGIHRGMGTHISRVKSVDLDAWTDEQLQSILQWGNTRGNKYWEAKLASGHVPSESKIENFIRTKYESKRWVMDGGIPDPATLDDGGDEEVPLRVVQEKQKLDSAAPKTASASSARPIPPVSQSQNVDLFGDNTIPAPRPSTTEPTPPRQLPPKSGTAPPKQTKPGDSLLGLDFFGPASTPTNVPDRPSSASAQPVTTGAPSRPDLKQSILSLYASAPRQPAQPQPQPQQQTTLTGVTSQSHQSGLGRLDDAFSTLNFSAASTPAQPLPPTNTPFSSLGSFSNPKTTPAPQVTSPTSAGGGFFNAAPKSSASQPQKPLQSPPPLSSSGGFDALNPTMKATPNPTKPSQPSTSSGSGDLFDFSSSSPPSVPTHKQASPKQEANSVFNLSAPPISTSYQNQQQTKVASSSTNFGSGWANEDAWGSSNAWSTPETSPPKNQAGSVTKAPAASSSGVGDFGWGGGAPSINIGGGFGTAPSPAKVSADEDFGGWSSAAGTATNDTGGNSGSKSSQPSNQFTNQSSGSKGGFGGSEDLFSNVWE